MEYKPQLEWKADTKQRSRLPGLHSDGWNCFANAMLQVLIHTPPVFNHFEKYSCRCGKDCVYCLMKEKIFNQAKTETSRRALIYPVPVLTHILNNEILGLKFNIGQDADPIEFYELLEKLMEDNKEESISKNFLKDIFTCQQEIFTHCKFCGNKIEDEDTYILPFIPIKSGNIVNSLTEYFGEKDTDVKKCKECKHDIHTAQRIITPPPILHLKSAESLLDIDFTKTLDISPYLAEENGKRVMYELNSVIVYVQLSPERGHYYSLCKAPSGQWNKYNDTKVTGNVSLKEVLEVKPYSLFYKRIQRPVENVIADKENKESKILKRKVGSVIGNKSFNKKRKLGCEYTGSNENVECRTNTLTKSPHPEKSTSAERIEFKTSLSTGNIVKIRTHRRKRKSEG